MRLVEPHGVFETHDASGMVCCRGAVRGGRRSREKAGHACRGGLEVEGTESVAARRVGYHPLTFPWAA